MLVQYSCLILLIKPCLTNGLMLAEDNIQLVQSLAADLGFTCITVIVEDVDRININVWEKLTKQDFFAIISELEDLEKIFKLAKNDRNKCLHFVFLSDVQLQSFLDTITRQ